jgi:hypothetical protein
MLTYVVRVYRAHFAVLGSVSGSVDDKDEVFLNG